MPVLFFTVRPALRHASTAFACSAPTLPRRPKVAPLLRLASRLSSTGAGAGIKTAALVLEGDCGGEDEGEVEVEGDLENVARSGVPPSYAVREFISVVMLVNVS